MILTLYDTGLRVGAALSAPLAALDRENRWLFVSAETQKQKADQVFKLHPDTLAALDRLPAERGMLFPWPFDAAGNWQALARHYRKILKRAGLSHGERDLFHKLRRTSGTYLADATNEQAAVDHLGHSTAKLTRDSYLDPRKIKSKVFAGDVLPRPDWKVITPNEDEAA